MQSAEVWFCAFALGVFELTFVLWMIQRARPRSSKPEVYIRTRFRAANPQ
jgi:hypothetical protein